MTDIIDGGLSNDQKNRILQTYINSKAYHAWRNAKNTHLLNEYKRVLNENDLMGEIVKFDKTKEDFMS